MYEARTDGVEGDEEQELSSTDSSDEDDEDDDESAEIKVAPKNGSAHLTLKICIRFL